MSFDIFALMDFKDENTKKRIKYRHGEDQPTNGIQILPQEVALDIVSRLPMKSLIQFRFVCKDWKKLTYDPNLISFHLSKSQKRNHYLIFHYDFPIKNFLYFVELSNNDDGENDKVRKFEIPFSDKMPEFNVVGSSNGLLCLVSSLLDEALYIYNPFTCKYKELPKPSPIYQDQLVMYGFGFHTLSKQYKVIKISYYSRTFNLNAIFQPSHRFILTNRNYLQSDVQVFCLSSNKWRSIGKVPYQLDRRCNYVLLNGRFHWTTNYQRNHGKRIVSFDLYDELFREVPSPEFDFRVHRRDYHLSTLRDCLCIAMPLIGNDGNLLDIWVMKEYDTKESWVKEFHIKAFCPNLINLDLQRSRGIWRRLFNRRIVRVLCLLKNGEILLEFKGGSLVSYNQENGLFKNVIFPKMPKLFQTTIHVGSLSWV